MTKLDNEGIGSMVRAELSSRTRLSTTELVDERSLDDVGIDSLALIDVLMSLQEHVSAEQGLSIDDVDELDVLPWLETVGDLVAFATSFVSDSEQSAFVGKPTALSGVG
jgi:acyl carrier protein